MAEDTGALRWGISGRVQGVWYRDFVRREARSLGIRGWVKNLPDGSVEARVLGPRDKLAELKRRLHEGPPLARVASIAEEVLDTAAAAELGEGDFEVRY